MKAGYADLKISMCSRQLQYLSLHDNNLRALPSSVVQLLLDEKDIFPVKYSEVIPLMPDSEARAFADLRQELQWLYLYNNKLQDLPQGIGRQGEPERSRIRVFTMLPLSKSCLLKAQTQTA